mmetsp:Transcript_14881/g.35929  ORF Transcript_14881/g.35929 Transcript_14881/m.35929 type:complete len:812 (-) Transcript_14881:260-2695(-)
MYLRPLTQYSLVWYVNLFNHAIVNAEKSDAIEARLGFLIDFFTYSLYKNICRSLFEKDKLLFSFTLAATIFGYKGTLDPTEYRFLLTGGLGNKEGSGNLPAKWMSEKLWLEMLRLSDLPTFKGFSDDFKKDPSKWQHIYDSSNPEQEQLPEPWNAKLDPFQKLMALRTLRPDKLTIAVQIYVDTSMGRRFIEPPPFDLGECYADSTAYTPLVFVLSPGSDPMSGLITFSESMGVALESLSLGQGQGVKAEKLIAAAVKSGSWVILQNCHLAVSWMTTLDRICEEFNTAETPPNPAFRLWLTSYPSEHFPVAVLQNGIKMTNEPPKGMRANMMQSFLNDPVNDPDFFEGCSRPGELKKLLVGLAFFHAFVQERKKFGPLGWNIPYGFNDPDLKISLRQLRMFLNEARPDQDVAVPLKALVYLVGECNYGGRVTDDKDRRLMNNLLFNYIAEGVVSETYSYSPSGVYVSPNCNTQADFVEFIKTLPQVPAPEIFGLHENADITCDQNETYAMFETVLSLQPRVNSGGGLSREDVIEASAKDIFERCPPPFDIDQVHHQYPTDYNQSMNTVLTQECIRYNALIIVMRKSLQESLKALKGLVVMSPELEGVTNSIFDNQVPDMWGSKAYPSLKPLSSWVIDLLERIKFINQWIDKGPPPVYWISGLFFPQAFLTGTLQNYARKYQIAIDTVMWNFNVEDKKTFASQKTPPEDGCYVSGYFLEGARWDFEKHQLAESKPKELYTDFPMMWLEPKQHRVAPTEGFYECPAYKTLTRNGTLSTTGHSTNFVMYMEVPTDKSQSHWINRSVAVFTALMF